MAVCVSHVDHSKTTKAGQIETDTGYDNFGKRRIHRIRSRDSTVHVHVHVHVRPSIDVGFGFGFGFERTQQKCTRTPGLGGPYLDVSFFQ